MSLPPGFLDELRAHLSLGQVVGRKVMWDNRKSNQAKGDLWAPCPFHQEKTASFHVDDRKGFYYCFGCHAKGDAISFVRETENVDFMEAVRILAGEAGMQMPERDPQARRKADRRDELAEVMEKAVRFFRMQLRTGPAGDARAYLERRGLGAEAVERWEIGFAPPGWQGLRGHMTQAGIGDDVLQAAGLVKTSDRGREPFDVFRERIIFPIRDGRGRTIAFGGRAMRPDDPAKYLNSPETELFDKSRALYNQGPARVAAGKGKPLIVAEGYMDVIALSEHGFEAAVAPLGTAVTEHQLRLMWRMSDEPVIALDGDAAGIRAAQRVVSLALPLLEAGKSLRFALMPQGQDPDDLLRSKGAAAMETALAEAQPMVRLLWQSETEGRSFDSPERRAALDKSLRARLKEIRDASIRGHYAEEIRRLRWELFRAGPAPRWGRKAPPASARRTTRASALAAGGGNEERLREAVILATLIANPAMLAEFEGELERLELTDPDHAALRAAILAQGPGDDLRGRLATRVGEQTLEKLFSQAHVAITPAVRSPGDPEVARMCLAEELAKLNSRRGHAREIEEAMEDIAAGLADEHVTARLAQSGQAMDRAGRNLSEDRIEYDVAPNGARVSRDERANFQASLEKIRFAKTRDRPS